MKPARAILLWLLVASCVETRSVALTFGSEGEGLDGFLCKDPNGTPLLERRRPDVPASLVVDFVRLGGVPGCRIGQLIQWCATHACEPIAATRTCIPEVILPTGVSALPREELRAKVRASIGSLAGAGVSPDAPDEFVLVRVVGTAQSCESLKGTDPGLLPPFSPGELLGCAYSCPVLLDRVEQDVFLGFDTLTSACEQGVRTCAAGDLRWQI